ncbi:hypothetical protein [Streptomyces sp. wa13]|uniref:hypothetical protein n=1 Tax=Streptomyces sp. wa13 TaxID=1828236 RepID=UPI003C7C40E3
MTPITHTARVLTALARLRFILSVAGVAWLLGYSPEVGGRIVVGLVVVLLLVVDAMADATTDSPTIIFGRKGGAA